MAAAIAGVGWWLGQRDTRWLLAPRRELLFERDGVTVRIAGDALAESELELGQAGFRSGPLRVDYRSPAARPAELVLTVQLRGQAPAAAWEVTGVGDGFRIEDGLHGARTLIGVAVHGTSTLTMAPRPACFYRIVAADVRDEVRTGVRSLAVTLPAHAIAGGAVRVGGGWHVFPEPELQREPPPPAFSELHGFLEIGVTAPTGGTRTVRLPFSYGLDRTPPSFHWNGEPVSARIGDTGGSCAVAEIDCRFAAATSGVLCISAPGSVADLPQLGYRVDFAAIAITGG